MEQSRRDVIAALVGLSAIAVTSTALRAIQTRPNPTVAALVLLLVVLITSTAARLRVSIAISFATTLVFDYFLLPPLNSWAIADPDNLVPLFVFVSVAIIASQLSAAARQQAKEALARKLEVTRLFDLSRDILLTSDSDSAIADVARYAAQRFELDGIAICLPAATGWDLHQGGTRAVEPSPDQLDQAFARTTGGHVVVADGGREGPRSFCCASARSRWACWRPVDLSWTQGRLMPLAALWRSRSNAPTFSPSARNLRRCGIVPIWHRRFSRRSATIFEHR